MATLLRTDDLIRPVAALCVAFSLGIVAAACGRDSPAPTVPGLINPPAGGPASAGGLEIVSAPTSLLVNESGLFTVKVRNAGGPEVQLPPDLQWRSSDERVVRVQPGDSGSAVVTALRRGKVSITASAGNLVTVVSLTVTARVSIVPERATPCEFSVTVCVGTGETSQFNAVFVDIDGTWIDERPAVTWASSAPNVASVNSSGHVTSLQPGRATITASSIDGVGAIDVNVTAVIAGAPARVRFAHADHSRGPLTFVPSQGTPVTLSFGESVHVPIVSGTFSTQVAGVGSIDRLIRDGDRLEIFATSWGLTGGFTSNASLPADSGLIRFVQGTGSPNFALVVLLGAPGATVQQSRLLHCYFDPLDVTYYVPVRVGEFDVLAGGKGVFLGTNTVESARERISVTPGRAVTYVIAGDRPQTMRLLAFPDF